MPNSRRFWIAAAAAVGSGLAAGPARADGPPVVSYPSAHGLPAVPCPPGPYLPGTPYMPGQPAPVVPYTPGTPTTPGGTTPQPNTNPTTPPTPAQPDAPPAPAQDPAAPQLQATQGGTSSEARVSPDLFGDLLGSRAIRIQYRAMIQATVPVVALTTARDGSTAVVLNPKSSAATFQFIPPGRSPVGVNGGQINTPSNLQFTQPLVAGNQAQFDAAFARSALQTLLDRRQLSPDQARVLSARLSDADARQLASNAGQVNQAITQATKGLTVPAVRVGAVTGQVNGPVAVGSTVTYNADLLAESLVTYPSTNAVVGRVKLAEGNNPLPRDRVIFAYDHFNSVPLTQNGIDVNRFQFGVEKTFLDGRASLEVRLPFAGTIGSTNIQGFETRDVELGNLRLALKNLWTSGQYVNFGTGVAVTLPTADDVSLRTPAGVGGGFGGQELYRLKNESVTVEPYAAVLLTPTDRLFNQTWVSVNFDTTGSPLTYNRNVFGGNGQARLFDLPFLALDTQLGYWLVKPGDGSDMGLAPFLELHYNHAIAQDTILRKVQSRTGSQGLNVSGVASDEFSITLGLNGVVRNLNYSVGLALPLLDKPDRTFDWQLGFRLSYLFGRSAGQRSAAYNVNSF